MADNIKIIGNINDIQRLNRLNPEDLNLLSSEVKNQIFGFENDYIEFFIYDSARNLINSNYNYRNFKLPTTSFLTPGNNLPLIEIDPVNDLQSLGYISGEFITQYNFQTRKISSPDAELFISEISEDRTEIRINSLLIPSNELLDYGNKLINELNTTTEQKYFLLNLIDNTQFLVINIATDVDNSSILLKLYEPLPQSINPKTSLWITEELIEPYVFNLNLDTSIIPSSPDQLRGPNFSINVDVKQNVATKYENYSSLVSSLTGSSYYQVLNYMNNNSYDLNIDYTSFNNFIHFSSSKTRLNIFYTKVKQIEGYNNDINIVGTSNSLLKTQQTSSIQQKINDIVSKFDGFENYLYFESSSYTWPKSNNNKPYILLSTGSATALSWFNNYTGSAELYDNDNLDRLYNVIPNYIKNDPGNYQPYYDFIDMIGHYFDNVWIYISSINDLYNANNNLKKGISKDIVYDALRSLGVKLYNSKGNNDFTDYISGLNSGSSVFTDDFSVTSSFLNNVPKKDQLAELYKRIYHNIPLLSKTKGTSTGLQNLMTTFGVTSSIFSSKEFGGSTKRNEIKGYVTDKIVLQNNTITGSVLSPFISLQQPFTGSLDFLSTDLHFVDLSFSPQNQLNARMSASIAATFPTFSLDEYIGDPRLYSSSSYTDLNIQKDRFISTSAAVSGSAKRLDYKGFFELVKYFDNSLFKMLKDFVPARTNALTGITIKSPVLERNKIATYRPNVDKQTTYDAKYNGPVISEDNDYIYDKLIGTKSSFYDGIISGSYINVYNYFTDSFPNPYLFPAPIAPSSSFDTNLFNHTDFNVTLNNVFASRASVNRYKLEDIYTSTGKYVFKTSTQYSSSAELQDSYSSLLGHSRSRYDGTKLSSVTYNTYTSASLTYSGDTSYGKTAVIDHYVRKIGLFTQIEESKLFSMPKRNNTSIKYLVDESGNFTELNKKNKHWCEVQNTFKNGDNLTVSLFDNQKSSNQRKTDGIKSIFNSGYSYYPILYTGKDDTKLYFNYAGVSTSKLFKVTTTGGSINVINQYPIISGTGNIPALFSSIKDTVSLDGGVYYNANAATFPTYSVQETSNQSFTAQFDVNVNFASVGQSATFEFKIDQIGVGGASPVNLASQLLTAASGFTSTVFTSGYDYCIKTTDTYTLTSALTVYDIGGTQVDNIAPGTTLYKIIAYPYIYNNSGNCTGYGSKEFYVTSLYLTYISNPYCYTPQTIYTLPSNSYKKLYTLPTSTTSKLLSFNLTTPYKSFTAGNKIGFSFTTGSGAIKWSDNIGATATINAGGVLYNTLVADQSGPIPYATSTTFPFISGSINGDTLMFSYSLSAFKDYEYIPSGSGNYNSLYTTYKDIEYTFSPKSGDIIIVYYNGDGSFIESTIANVVLDFNNRLLLQLNTQLPNSLNIPQYNSTSIDRWVILSKINDETNALLTFDKPSGTTSYGFIIPQNLHPDMLKNIDTITKEVKQKLIDMSSINGGSF
jgi:hypothetical protein